ncbi:LysR family transcriptional regulator [Adlercreutzia sp. ZJ304]|uniref:LysR family transcriptional regulator n=1 Tax=Adlercreutzia sp. ZJ304 TaxID=2709791 RepID=UPI0013EAF803|nr:LysR family transcriptional regulator [Adlercreutzia sp. ZJ304]
MTLQQLRYLIEIAACGSISQAAHNLYTSQSSLSVAVKDVEAEMGVTIFERSNRGITVTREGMEFLGYARQVVEQANLLEQRYARDAEPVEQHLSVSSQHYTFCVESFLEFVDEYEGSGYTFTLRECRTSEIINDVRDFRSDVGILFMSSFNQQVIGRALEDANCAFAKLFTAKPHIFVNSNHPLAAQKIVTLDDLTEYPRYTFEQGNSNSFYYSEEPFAELPASKRVIISDRGTLSNLLTHHMGYIVSTGVMSSEMSSGVVAVPIDTKEIMTVGYIVHNERQLSSLAARYIEKLQLFIEEYQVGYSGL